MYKHKATNKGKIGGCVKLHRLEADVMCFVCIYGNNWTLAGSSS